MLHPEYPSPEDVDRWCLDLLREADGESLSARLLDEPSPSTFTLGIRHHEGHRYVCFTTGRGETFYGLWQPVLGGGPAPILLHLPGYAAEMSAHPELVIAGWNVLHVNPLGYATPAGPDEAKRRGDTWPVLPDTVESGGARGYRDFLRQVAHAFRWAVAQPGVQADRPGVFGTSQGGGTALLAASLLRDRGVKAVAADVPFLTNFPLMADREEPGAYHLAQEPLRRLAAQDSGRLSAAWRALGFVDTLSHAHRLAMPVLLTAGTLDVVTPPETIDSLYRVLPGTRSYTELAGQAHGYTAPFLRLARAWFDIYL